MAATSDVEQGASADSGPVACVVNHPGLKAAANSNLPELDAALAGLVVENHPAAAGIDETWIESPRWARVVRELRKHQAQGGSLGDIVAASEVLDAAGVAFPRTSATEAVLAALEAAPATYVVDCARERAVRLRVHRLARVVERIADADLDKIPMYLGRVAAELHCAAASRTVEAQI
jgi:hypothetical protein